MSLLAVGTFNTNELFTVRFDAEKESLQLLDVSQAKGNHSWLSTATIPGSSCRDEQPTNLYATCWTQPPSVAAYRIQRDGTNSASFKLLNTAETAARSGYVYVGFPGESNHPVLYTCGGPTGEVVGIDSETGGFDLTGAKHQASIPAEAPSDGVTGIGSAGRIQEINFVTGECSVPGKSLAQTKDLRRKDAIVGSKGTENDSATTSLDASGGKNAMDFGGLRHGSHGIDLSPDGTVCYVPDIGRNCIWTMNVDPTNGTLSLGEKSMAPRKNDGPRHTISHPAGRYIYSLQEHSSMVDVFELIKDAKTVRLEWKQGVKIIPRSDDEGLYWADEVRLSPSAAQSDGEYPLYMFASTRGLAAGTKGWVAVFQLDRDGGVVPQERDEKDELGDALCLWQTPTSGGWANAIEPAPTALCGPLGDAQYAVLTDSEVGEVRMLRLDVADASKPHVVSLQQVATLKLGNDARGKLREAATAVWI
ncbi:related to muconate cycloisomerase [Melanopsichium pennsylvanicum]|uniref:Related to muconate cycloisomerase n=2 Tax=Melanopsichium pennsylvanicum TaxID=63383 RepID=A0AAJ4XMF1_9BASI|nr:related to muconate cycloisomerase [Melanopsichium pennsylvanicum 4]SNX85509.1 related to muconate cycloisomerase [Melanopsichium pennsylvanicum]